MSLILGMVKHSTNFFPLCIHGNFVFWIVLPSHSAVLTNRRSCFCLDRASCNGLSVFFRDPAEATWTLFLSIDPTAIPGALAQQNWQWFYSCNTDSCWWTWPSKYSFALCHSENWCSVLALVLMTGYKKTKWTCVDLELFPNFGTEPGLCSPIIYQKFYKPGESQKSCKDQRDKVERRVHRWHLLRAGILSPWCPAWPTVTRYGWLHYSSVDDVHTS